MKIRVRYWNQLKSARGVSDESLQMDDGSTLHDLLQRVGEPAEMRQMLFDSDGGLLPWILVDCAGTMVRDTSVQLSDGLEVNLLTHISGG